MWWLKARWQLARRASPFQWKRERRSKEGWFHYQPTCRLMLHNSTQPTVVMVATCHVICVSPWMNGDLWDMLPPPGSLHRGCSGSVSSLRAAGDTPTATYFFFFCCCLRMCLCSCVCACFPKQWHGKLASSGLRCHLRENHNSNSCSRRNIWPSASQSENVKGKSGILKLLVLCLYVCMCKWFIVNKGLGAGPVNCLSCSTPMAAV